MSWKLTFTFSNSSRHCHLWNVFGSSGVCWRLQIGGMERKTNLRIADSAFDSWNWKLIIEIVASLLTINFSLIIYKIQNTTILLIFSLSIFLLFFLFQLISKFLDFSFSSGFALIFPHFQFKFTFPNSTNSSTRQNNVKQGTIPTIFRQLINYWLTDTFLLG